MLDDIVADNIAQGIGIPIPATKDRLLPPWTRIARRLGAHPTGLALLIAEQTFQKQACVPRNAFLPEQRTYPLLHFPKRRCPQCKRLFNRRCTRPRSSNHGCPWIQISSERATVMLGGVVARNHVQGRGLAAAIRADQAVDLPGLDIEIKAVDGAHIAETQRDAAQTESPAARARAHDAAERGRTWNDGAVARQRTAVAIVQKCRDAAGHR